MNTTTASSAQFLDTLTITSLAIVVVLVVVVVVVFVVVAVANQRCQSLAHMSHTLRLAGDALRFGLRRRGHGACNVARRLRLRR